MALIDYKLKSFSHEGRHVKIVVSVSRGRIETFNSVDLYGQPVAIPNVYVRIAKVRDFAVEYDVPRDMTKQEFIEKARAYLNNKIMTFAQNNGHTVITEQTDVTDLKPVLNEKEI